MTATTEKRPSAEKHEGMVNDETRTFTEADFPIGTVAHQGDLIFVRLDGLPPHARRRDNRQLAEGNTQGSRHVLAFGEPFDCDVNSVAKALCRLTKEDIASRYIGPVIQTVGGVAEVEHPEHGDHRYEGDMTIACVYQRNLDADEREARVRD